MRDWRGASESVESAGPIVAWVVLLYALTFLCALPIIIGGVSLPKLSPSVPLFPFSVAGFTLAGFTPMLAALLVARLFPGAGGVRPLFRQLKTWHVGIGWYAIALIGPIVLSLLADVIHIVLGGASPEKWVTFPSVFGFFPGSLFFMIVGLVVGSFGEEPGWRGFAQPRLQMRYGALAASILVGFIWATWHIWIVITPGALSLMTLTEVVTQYVRLIATAVIYAWMYNSTKGSLLLVMVAHAGHNLASNLIRTPSDGPVIVALGYVVLATFVVLMTESRTLSRSKGDRSPEGVPANDALDRPGL
jgi:uncharacterized protein